VTAPASAIELGRRLLVLPEAEMRRRALWKVLSELSDEEAVTLLGELCRHGRDCAETEVATLALATVLEKEDLGYERQAGLYQLAKQLGDELVARLLLSSGRQPGSQRGRGDEALSEPSMPLGWRKAMARSPRRDVIDRLLFDPDPAVLTILLGNPRVVERDAVGLAARRPTTAAAQRVVFSSRYGARQEVRRALVLNPYTPVELSARVLPGLFSSDLVEVAKRQDLASPLRDEALLLLASRRPQKEEKRGTAEHL
jgi:hypothetical protein